MLAFCAAAFDPAGTTARQSMLPEAAARAGWSLDRTNSIYEAILNLALHRGPGHRRFDDRHGGRHQHDVGHGGLLRVVLPRDRGAAARGRRQATPRDPARGVGVRHRRRTAIRLEPAGAPDARVDRPGRDRAVPADGKRAVPQVLHRPAPTRAVGLGVDGARGRRRGGRARLCRAVEAHAAAHGRADRDPHLRRGDGRHRVPAAAARDPGAVRGDRPGLRADPADLQLRDADPGAAAAARPGGRGDDGADLRRGPVGLAGGRSPGRRRRAEGHLPGAGGADPGGRADRVRAAVAARTGPRAGVR